MSNITMRTVKILLATVLALAGALGGVGVAGAAPAVPAGQPGVLAPAECGNTTGFEQVDLSELPAEATDTVELIRSGGPFPYPEDGTVFHNWEGLLPDCAEGYYHEYTVDTPGVEHRGARRIVTGSDGEYFYTDDHYESFSLVDINA